MLAGSRFLNPAESRYAPCEGEALAVAWGLEQTKYFTQGCPNLLIVTDHKPLVKVLGDRTLDEIENPRLFRLKQKTGMWHFKIAYLPGKTNEAADAASRSPSKSTPLESPIAHLASMPAMAPRPDDHADEDESRIASEISSLMAASMTVSWNDLAAAAAADGDYRELIHAATEGFPAQSQSASGVSRLWPFRKGIYIRDGIALYNDRVIVPASLRRRILESLHAAHQSVPSMLSRA